MELDFVKMHGAGNDFIMVNENVASWPTDTEFVRKICSRTKGIGADGIILLKKEKPRKPITLRIFNSDGSMAEMCGNGLRCSTLFAYRQMGAAKKMLFQTAAGRLETEVTGRNRATIEIPLLLDFQELMVEDARLFFGNTGVPHTVIPVKNVQNADVAGQGRFFRFHKAFKPAGTNVNFIELDGDSNRCFIRTYERGVEAETSACGTGAAATAVCLFKFFGKSGPFEIITAENDVLGVELITEDNIVIRIKLSGDAQEVFRGRINVKDFR